MRKVTDKALEILLIALMGLLVVVVLWQVTSRYLLTNPSSYTDELAGFLLIWVGLLGAAYTCGQKEHLAIDLLVQRSKPRTRITLEMVIYAFTFLFAATVLVVGGVWLVYTRFLLDVTSASLELGMGYVYLALPLSGLLIMYYSFDNARRSLAESRSVGRPNAKPAQ